MAKRRCGIVMDDALECTDKATGAAFPGGKEAHWE